MTFILKEGAEMGMKGHFVVDKSSSDSTAMSVLVLGSST